MNKEWLKLCQDHNIEVWYEERKQRFCMQGQALAIANCLKATRAKKIIINGEVYKIEDVTHQIYQLTEIKIAFNCLIF